MNHPIYLDYNATTPLSELVKAELVRLLQLDLGNPSRAVQPVITAI